MNAGLCIDTRVRDTVTMAGLIPIIHEKCEFDHKYRASSMLLILENV